jgi:hypothetical protein
MSEQSRQLEGESREQSFTLGRYMKGMVSFYWVVVFFFAGIASAAIGRQASSGNLQPIAWSNLTVVGLAVFILSLFLFLLGCGYTFLMLAKTTISSWGIRRPSWSGAIQFPWADVALVTADPIGLRFETKKGRTLVIPFRILDSVPPLLLDLLGKHIPRSALAGLGPGPRPSWWSKQK